MSAPYDALLMDHIKNARNYRVLGRPSRELTGSNVLCGDELTLYLTIQNERIEDIAFQCSCCGICMASTSVMTGVIKGKTTDEAETLLQEFIDVLRRSGEESLLLSGEQQAILEAARKFPARARCASLPWTTLRTGLEVQRA